MRQSNKSFALCLFFSFVLSGTALAQTKPVTAQEVVEKAIHAMGGREKMLEVQRSFMQGRLDIKGVNIQGTFKIYSERPNKFYAWFDVNSMGILERGYNGETYWEKSSASGARIFRGKELKLNALLAHFDLLYYDQIYKELKLLPSSEINGEKCQSIEMLAPDCPPITMFFSETTGLPVEQRFILPTAFENIKVSNKTLSYKTIQGQKVPYHMVQTVRGMETHRFIDHIEFNGDFGKDRFNLPQEIKALVDQEQAQNTNDTDNQ